jgi:hypothetical protein
MSNKSCIFAAIACLTAVSELCAQIISPRLAGTTGTQAVISYAAPDSNPCSIVVSESPAFSPLVHDVDSSLFAGADLDSRQLDLNNGQQRTIVIGHRRSDLAVDGKLYSRALQVSTQHFYRLTCGAAVASGSFTTRDLPMGDSFPENPPFDPAGYGNYGWPTIDWTNRNQSYIDPMTGVLVKLATFPGDWPTRNVALFGVDYWVDSTGHWTNPQNAVRGIAANQTSYSGAGNEALFVGIDPALSRIGDLHGGWGPPNSPPPFSVDDLGVHLIGSGTDAAPANRTVAICLSLDSGQTCYTNTINVVLSGGSTTDSGVQPANFPKPLFGGWGKAIRRADIPISGTVAVAGNVVTLTGQQDGTTFFNPGIAPGSKIHITGSAASCPHNLCTIASIQNATQLTIVESLQLQTAAYTFANVGLRIVKTTGTGGVSFTTSYEYALSQGSQLPFSNDADICSHVPVTVTTNSDGSSLPPGQKLTGFNCSINGSWYWISTITGESRLISLTNYPAPAALAGVPAGDLPNVLGVLPGVGAFDDVSGNVGYAYAPLKAGGFSLFKLTYTGNYSALHYNYPTGELPTSIADHVAWTNLMPSSRSLDIQSQILARVPAYDVAKFGVVSHFYGISGSYGLFVQNTSVQDSPCWVFLVNIHSGILEQAFNSWDGTYDPLMRWAACHSASAGTLSQTAILLTKPAYISSSTALYGGPFNSKITGVYRSGQLTSNTAVPPNADGSYDAACPAGLASQWVALGATGNACITFRIQGEPCSAFASAQEALWSPCPWDGTRSMLQTMAEGDLITDGSWTQYTGGTVGPDAERLRVVRKTPVEGSNQLDIVLQRNISQYCGSLPSERTHPSGWSLMMAPGGQWTCEGSYLTIDIPNRKVYGENRFLISGHSSYGVGNVPNTTTLIGLAALPSGNFGYAVRSSKPLGSIGDPADFYVNFDPQFAGIQGLPFSDLQVYSVKDQWNASLSDLRWALDFRHINGGFGIAEENPGGGIVANTTTLVPGTTSVYKITNVGALNVKTIPLLSFAGHYLLREKSGPPTGDALTDADAWRFCYAFQAGECRHDSTGGSIYVVVPQANVTGTCNAGQYARNIPCVMTAHPLGAWGLQFDVSHSSPAADAIGAATRRLTMGFSGPGRQYAYGSIRSLPDGKWALMSGWWLDGYRQDVLLVKLPPFRISDGVMRNNFTPVTLKIGAFAGAQRAAVDFGYGEYGNPSDFYCTPRAESCSALNPSINTAAPFLYASEGVGGASCRAGCTITVPALPARVLYYRIRYADSSGNPVVTGPIQVIASPEAAAASR